MDSPDTTSQAMRACTILSVFTFTVGAAATALAFTPTTNSAFASVTGRARLSAMMALPRTANVPKPSPKPLQAKMLQVPVKRDVMRPSKMPSNPLELAQFMTRPEFRDCVSTPLKRHYWDFALKRFLWFSQLFLMSPALAPEAINRFMAANSQGVFFEVFMDDFKNVVNGAYNMPWDFHSRHRQSDPLFVAKELGRILTATQGFEAIRKRAGGAFQVRELGRAKEDMPNYYLQNFHFQLDGWLSDESAASYECMTEMLFSGCQDAMQRQTIAAVDRHLKQRGDLDESQLTWLEVAGGTGRQHTFIKDNYPRARTTFSDLSPNYIAAAKERYQYYKSFVRRERSAAAASRLVDPTFVRAEAAKLSAHFQPESFDIVTCTYLFHELPPEVRVEAMAEAARALKPGGLYVLADSCQPGDVETFTKDLLLQFPAHFHEPYYESYLETDFVALAESCGLELVDYKAAGWTKVLAFVKPAEASPDSPDKAPSSSTKTLPYIHPPANSVTPHRRSSLRPKAAQSREHVTPK